MRVAGDKRYSYPRIRRWLWRRGIEAVFPRSKDEVARRHRRPLAFDRESDRRRNVVERWWGGSRRRARANPEPATNPAVIQLARRVLPGDDPIRPG